ncbi:MAG: hypothetical protein WBY71_12310 [Nitrososphaeraceae archaeon]
MMGEQCKINTSSASLYSFAILSLITVLALLLFCASNDDDGSHEQLLQNEIAKGVTATAASASSPAITASRPLNNTGQAASQSAESLVRSIMDPASLITSVINETGGDKTNSSATRTGHLGSSTNASNTVTSLSNGSNGSALASGNNLQKTIVRNIDTLLLAHQIIPPKDFIPLYDTSPYKILNGHLTAKIPCDTNYTSSLQILVGHLPDLKPVQLRLVKEFSTRGNICLYHVDLGSTTTMSSSTTATQNNNSRATGGGLQANKTKTTTAINTDLVLSNPTSDMVVLPNTSTVVIGINEIMPIDSTTAPPKLTPASSINDNNTSPNQSQERSGQISSMIDSMAAGMNKPVTK